MDDGRDDDPGQVVADCWLQAGLNIRNENDRAEIVEIQRAGIETNRRAKRRAAWRAKVGIGLLLAVSGGVIGAISNVVLPFLERFLTWFSSRSH